MAVFALINDQALIGGHRLFLGMMALRAGDDGFHHL
jgi:hypothetical protein